MKDKFKGYICGTDLLEVAMKAPHLPELFKSQAQLKRERSCWRECGIVEVEVKAKRYVKKAKKRWPKLDT